MRIEITQATVRRAGFEARRVYASGMDTDDLVQEALIAVWEADWKPGRGANRNTFEGMCMRRRLLSVVTASRRQKRYAYTVPIDETHADRADVAELVEVRDRLRRTIEGLQALTALERSALTASVHGVTYREVGIDAKAGDNAAARARRKLRAQEIAS